MDMGNLVIGLVIGFVAGIVTYHFVKRNNPGLEGKIDEVTDKVEDILD